MKTKTLLAVVTLLIPTVAAARVPVEPRAIFTGGVENVRDGELLQELAATVITDGHSCESISSVRPMLKKQGFTLMCNRFIYTYQVEMKGGKGQVTVD